MKQTKGRLTRDGAEVRRVQVMLDDATIERARVLGDGNLSQGIRKAVASLPAPIMATLLECLKSLPPDMVMRDLSAVRNEVALVSEHIARLGRDEEGYEVREEHRNYGKDKFKVIGIIGGLTVYRQV